MHYLQAFGLGLTLATTGANAAYSLSKSYQGSTFFDSWTFYNGVDANTTGNVLYQTREQATQEQLAYVNAAGNAIIKVDNTTNGANDPTFGRPSVKILSNDTIAQGSLVIMDAVHMPYGCSVWPAYWMQGINDWPNDGEIDIVENVNLQTNNRYALHTTNGCTHPAASGDSSIQTGTTISTDCFNATNGDQGCIVQDPSTNSYGAGFASSGGGVFAMLWDDDGIKIWSFTRSAIPSNLASSSPDPTTWGLPTADYPNSSCQTSNFFKPQTIIFDITVCGNFAGAADVFNPSCSGTCTSLVPDPTNYNNAYFEVSYVKVFTNGGTASSSTSSGSASSPTTSGSSTGAATRLAFNLRDAAIALVSGALALLF